MKKVTTDQSASPESELDPEVLAFRSQFNSVSPLDELVREGARKMLQTAIDQEVHDFLVMHSNRVDEQGRKQVVRNGYLPAREIQTGAGPLEVSQPRVRDNSPEKSNRVRFTSSILPRYLRRSKSIEELLPWLYLKGISTGDFNEALQILLGQDAANFSPNTIVRLKEKWSTEYQGFCRCDLSDKEYVSGLTASRSTFGLKAMEVSGNARVSKFAERGTSTGIVPVHVGERTPAGKKPGSSTLRSRCRFNKLAHGHQSEPDWAKVNSCPRSQEEKKAEEAADAPAAGNRISRKLPH